MGISCGIVGLPNVGPSTYLTFSRGLRPRVEEAIVRDCTSFFPKLKERSNYITWH